MKMKKNKQEWVKRDGKVLVSPGDKMIIKPYDSRPYVDEIATINRQSIRLKHSKLRISISVLRDIAWDDLWQWVDSVENSHGVENILPASRKNLKALRRSLEIQRVNATAERIADMLSGLNFDDGCSDNALERWGALLNKFDSEFIELLNLRRRRP
jgi:hypothetical protein